MRKRFTCLLLPLLAISSGCSGSGFRDNWSGMMAGNGFRQKQPAFLLDGEPAQEVSKEFKEAQKLFKDPERVLLSYARMKEDHEEYAEARAKYREIITAYPKNVDACLGLARIEIATGRMEQAQRILVQLAEKHPKNSAVYIESGRMFSKLDQYPDAIRQFEKACELNPNDQNARYELGLAFIKLNQLDDAMSHLTFAVGESAAMYNIGYLLQEQGRLTEAAAWYRRALKAHPDEKTAHQAQQMLAKLTQPAVGVAPQTQVASWNGATGSGQTIQSAAVSQLPEISNSRRPTTQHAVPPQRATASNEHPVATQERNQATSASFRTVSFAPMSGQQSGNSHHSGATSHEPIGQASYVTDPLPEWDRPSTERTSPVTVGASVNAGFQQSAKIQEPPVWRARP